MKQQIAVLAPLAALVAVHGCDSGGLDVEGCIPGETQACFCGGGRLGVQECAETGDEWGKCDCRSGDADTDVDTDSDADTDSDSDLCGNGRLDAGELCDGSDLNEQTCQKLNFYRGDLACTKYCTYDIRGCDGFCGDGLLEEPEECEGFDLSEQTCQSFGYYRGLLSCGDDCRIDLSGCEERCGDGVVNGPEQCDGPELQDQTCDALGYYSGATICKDDCTLDYSDCSGSCLDGILQTVEECDGDELRDENCQSQGFYTGEIDCTDYCTLDTSGCSGFCGDGVVNGDEECDDEDLVDQDCSDHGFYKGVLLCASDCKLDTTSCREWCGDHVVNGNEVCDDGTNDNSYGSCTPDCSARALHCGDGIITSPHEECDDEALADASCQDFDFYKGDIACGDNCKFDTAGCSEYCGDGIVNGEEECDLDDLDNQGCTDHGFTVGHISCTSSCVFDTTLCAGCAVNDQGFQECSTPDGRGGPYILIPEGTFWMGCNQDGQPPAVNCVVDELPQHEVRLSGYGIDKYEVTQANFALFVEETGHRAPPEEAEGWSCNWDPETRPDNPVECLAWEDLSAYCQWLGGSIPSEAQWEYSARGPMNDPTDSVAYPWGTTDIDCSYLNFNPDGTPCIGALTSVGSYPLGASPFGLHDLAGNVREWVLDWYSSDYYATSPTMNPCGPVSGEKRVHRGGTWGNNLRGVRTGVREKYIADQVSVGFGGRCERPAQ